MLVRSGAAVIAANEGKEGDVSKAAEINETNEGKGEEDNVGEAAETNETNKVNSESEAGFSVSAGFSV
ncbi:hypothetical protein OCS_00977 [Ophiocordyceps sinensis CO18]|uniref:Uncharacterized protein n=1 Tax=Ophiocordyceps sinensis (strain Co18 / CGMCC 3.14243) TaxID=911162 RepID=T5ACY6_OPHSC|nr:hypothetical protein OCS_05126 [Ophiocordyceps sinensis CO18]EQL03325.1 hypothetical protein OCS_00977 [Ophiocordyceps sinensis CO18]